MEDNKTEIFRDSKKLGSYTYNDIRNGLNCNILKPTDLFWDENKKAWRPLSEFFTSAAWEVYYLSLAGIACLFFLAAKHGVIALDKSDIYRHSDDNLTWTLFWVVGISYAAFAISTHHPSHHPFKRLVKLTHSFLIIITLSFGFNKSTTCRQMWADFSIGRPDLTFEPRGDFSREIFPSIEISLSNLSEKAALKTHPGDSDAPKAYNQRPQGSTIGVLLHDLRKGDRYTVKIQSDRSQYDFKGGYSNKDNERRILRESIFTFVADQDSQSAQANPELVFDFKALAKANQTQPINLSFEVTRNGGSPHLTNQVWQLRQLRDCPIGILNKKLNKDGKTSEEYFNTTFFFAAYVNENHPAVDRLISEALATGKVNAFTGYQGNRASVIRQMEAIWSALEARNIKYSSIASTTGSKSHVQHVRLIEDTLNSSQANCVDGSTLYASIARKVGLDPVLVIAPGHCYVAVDLGKELLGIEMTMLGRSTFADAVEWATNKGPHSIANNIFKFTRPSEDQQHFLISIRECRDLGIQPIPYSGSR